MNKCKSHTIIVSIGSNQDAKNNVAKATLLLTGHFKNMSESPAKETKPVGIDNDTMFVNKIIMGETVLSYHDVERTLKELEMKCGETRSGRKDGVVIVDLDLLKYDDTKYHKTDWNRGYVVELLAEIDPKVKGEKQ